jgi:hypothetical protein
MGGGSSSDDDDPPPPPPRTPITMQTGFEIASVRHIPSKEHETFGKIIDIIAETFSS